MTNGRMYNKFKSMEVYKNKVEIGECEYGHNLITSQFGS